MNNRRKNSYKTLMLQLSGKKSPKFKKKDKKLMLDLKTSKNSLRVP